VVLYTADAANSAKTSAAVLENQTNHMASCMSDGHIFSDVAAAVFTPQRPNIP